MANVGNRLQEKQLNERARQVRTPNQVNHSHMVARRSVFVRRS